MALITLQLTLTLQGPYLTQSSTPTDYGVDVPLAENHEKQFYIPATLLIGKLRESWKELKTLHSSRFPVNIERWLGDPSDSLKEENTVEPHRKQLVIEDLLLITTTEETLQRPLPKHYRIQINPQLGSVKKGAYIVTEKPFATGEKILFRGNAYFLTKDENEKNDILFCLKKGLQWIEQLGANRTIGFGELLDAQVELMPSPTPIQTVLPKNTRYALKLQPHTPFCLAEPRVTGNLFRSVETISGGAIKGVLATMFANDLPENFDQLHISHAFPSRDTMRPVRLPLSLVQVGKQCCYDVALCETPVLFWEGQGTEKPLVAPAFAIDWKDDQGLNKEFGWPAVKRELRVRTAIDSEKQRSKDGQLFAYEMVLPTLDQERLNWLAYVDLSAISEDQQETVIHQLQQLTTHGLLGLGKTKAVVDAALLAIDDIKPCHSSQCTARDGFWIITLQTPVLLSQPQIKLTQAYRDTWQRLSNQSLEMIRFFATQNLTGGRYIWKRFQDHRVDPQQPQLYRPYLLTDAGSVFVLKAVAGQESRAEAYIKQWLNTGLPLAQHLIEWYELSDDITKQWQQCPYVPQNGYGEIAVNLPIHWDLCPEKGDFEPISNLNRV